MPTGASNQELIQAWKKGDQNAASVIFHRYQARLVALVRSSMSRKLARRIDPEDVMLSAYRSFFVGTHSKQFVTGDDDNLWPLLTTIVLRKLAHQARRHSAGRRTVEREQTEDSSWIKAAISKEPTAEQAVELIDEVERLMNQLDQTAQEVLISTLQGRDTRTIAEDLKINERSVRRAQERIRSLLPRDAISHVEASQTLAVPGPNVIDRLGADRLPFNTTTYDQYLLQSFLGAGAFSKVYLALERASGKQVAIKFLKKECWSDARAKLSFIREYELLRNLKHPQILTIQGCGTTRGGALFLVTDLIRGMNLDQWRETKRPTLRQMLDVFQQVTLAVSAAHSQNVLHGDLKPANVMIRNDGEAILCDFGLARLLTAPDEIPRGGTAGFLAPEQICDAFGLITIRSDVYGLNRSAQYRKRFSFHAAAGYRDVSISNSLRLNH